MAKNSLPGKMGLVTFLVSGIVQGELGAWSPRHETPFNIVTFVFTGTRGLLQDKGSIKKRKLMYVPRGLSADPRTPSVQS